ncbi:hypothetical protein AAKU55_003019 [Oxalobacteraceae bacterium GrIS 1.11]
MNKDIVKGALILALGLAVVFGLLLLLSDSGPDKAACIAHALKNGMPVGNIDKMCSLSGH